MTIFFRKEIPGRLKSFELEAAVTPKLLAILKKINYLKLIPSHASKFRFLNLEVIDGWVSINKDNVETLVLSNHFCQIRADSGVGLPYHKFSAKEFVEAINNYCFTSPGNEEALISILTKADVSNSVTLWNLMQRVTRKQRDMVIYTMFGLLGNPPQGVTDEGLRTLDPGMMQKLIEEIEPRI